MDNSQYDTRDVKRICGNKLGIEFSKHSGKRAPHYTGWFYKNGQKLKRITVAKGRKPIPPKTYKTMAKQLGIQVKEFDLLLECPFIYKDYVHAIEDT